VVEAQARRQRETAIEEAQFVLHEHTDLTRLALREIVQREVLAGQRLRVVPVVVLTRCVAHSSDSVG
jgi:hypothetical protein